MAAAAPATFLLANMQGLVGTSRNKSPFLCDLIENHNSIWFAVTETWLGPDISDSELLVHLSGYTLLRSDRAGRERGGVCLFLRDDHTGEVLNTFSNGVCELLVVQVHQLNTVVAVCYRPPDTTLREFQAALVRLDEVLMDLPAPTPTIALMGDFNFPASVVTWSREDEALLHRVAAHRQVESDGPQVRQQCNQLCELMAKHSMVQTVDSATHGHEVLDLIWTNNQDLLSDIKVTPYLEFTDHSIITATTSYKVKEEKSKEHMFLLESGRRLKALDFPRAPWPAVRARLQHLDWSPMVEQARESPTAAYNWLMAALLPLLEELVPARKVGQKRGKRRVDKQRRRVWRRLGRVRGAILTTASATRMAELLSTKQVLEEELRCSYAATGWEEEAEVVSRMKTNPKAFFAFAKARQQTRAKVGPFIDPSSGLPNPDPDFTAEQLSEQYSSVFVQPRAEWAVPSPPEFFATESAQNKITDFNFTEQDIVRACKELKPDSAPGPDGIPAELLRTARAELARPLHILWRASLDHGSIPPELLLVQVCPLHKGGSRSVAKNYRPVALTSHTTKVFERVVRRVLVSHLEEHGHLPDGQHGFRAGRSCLTQLLSFWDTLLEEMEQGRGVDVVYTDYAKAFDKCEIGVLLHRLRDSGVMGKVGCWLAAFLDPATRQQAVGVDGRLSALRPVTSGVPQGTVLGPVLFLVHIALMGADLSTGTTITSFADDTRLKRGIVEEQDCAALQLDLEAVYSWADRVNMHFNETKFEVLRFWADRSVAPDILYMAPDGGPIEEKDCTRDLGVQVGTDLMFSAQVDHAVAAGSRMAGWVLRSFRHRSRGVMMTLLRCLVQPRLDYCSQLWSPSDQGSINRLEAVQHSFVSRIWDPELEQLDYWGKLELLRLYSQERRRERYMVCFLWKLSRGLISGYNVKWQRSDRQGLYAVPTPLARGAPAAVRRARERSLSVRGAKIFNLLPASLRNEEGDFDLFKNHLDIFLSGVPDQPTTAGLARAAATNSLLDQLPIFYN